MLCAVCQLKEGPAERRRKVHRTRLFLQLTGYA